MLVKRNGNQHARTRQSLTCQGTASQLLARTIAQSITEKTGHTIVIETGRTQAAGARFASEIKTEYNKRPG
jgi:hypothetical protein